jgi:hypothetical protein
MKQKTTEKTKRHKKKPSTEMIELAKVLQEMDFAAMREWTMTFWKVARDKGHETSDFILTAAQVEIAYGINEKTLDTLANIEVLKKEPMGKNPEAAWSMRNLQLLFTYPNALLADKVPGYSYNGTFEKKRLSKIRRVLRELRDTSD